jgi:hypothetical protein
MRSRLAFSVLVVASLFGATAIASAQTELAMGASAKSGAKESNANAMASMRHHHRMKSHHHHMGYSRAQMDKSRPGGRPVSRKVAD